MAEPGASKSRSPSDSPLLSVIIPVFNEEASVGGVLAELRRTLDALPITCEVLVIDDGSTDRTGAAIERVAHEWSAVQPVNFPENRGQAAALWHGFHLARGAWIAMLDGDGQNPPAELARLWDLRDTADMIAGERTVRRDSALRRAMSRVANTVRRVALRDGMSDSGCSLKVFRRDIVRSFLPVRTLYSFLPAFAVAGGWTVREVPVVHRPRQTGVSKYGLRAMAVHPLLDLLALCWILRRVVRQQPSSPREPASLVDPTVRREDLGKHGTP